MKAQAMVKCFWRRGERMEGGRNNGRKKEGRKKRQWKEARRENE